MCRNSLRPWSPKCSIHLRLQKNKNSQKPKPRRHFLRTTKNNQLPLINQPIQPKSRNLLPPYRLRKHNRHPNPRRKAKSPTTIQLFPKFPKRHPSHPHIQHQRKAPNRRRPPNLEPSNPRPFNLARPFKFIHKKVLAPRVHPQIFLFFQTGSGPFAEQRKS